MAIEINGLLSGRIGDKIYSVVNGQQRVRSMPKSVANPNTKTQQAQRLKIAEITRLSSDLKEARKIGLHPYALRKKKTEDAIFRKLNHNCWQKNQINYSAVIVSKGPIPTIPITSVEVDEQRMLRLTFDGCAMGQNNQEMFHLFVYCPDLRDCRPARPVLRSEGVVTVQLPPEWTDHDLHLYAFLRGKKSRVSNTMYVALPAEQSNPS